MFFNFDIGDYLLHPKYGIGKFISLQYIKLNNTGFDFLKIEYQDDSYIYVPTYHTGILKFHSTKDSNTKIESLRRVGILKKQQKVKEEIEKTAQGLIQIALKRDQNKVISLQKTSFFDNFCDNFEHQLTKSQSKALQNIVKDLSIEKPMDRLLCGDVGFGKTEVAARAIAYVLGNNKKALFLVPTTILAIQHFNSLKERFEKLGKTCVVISKLVKDNDLHKQMWQEGEIDLLITTVHHKFSEKLLIDDLGIVVLDEEHHFGAKLKEQIREKTNFLQLSATPIPRTLHLALSNIKDISILEESPYDKKKSNVFVKNIAEFNLNEVIQNELNNCGKVFIVVPRVEYIEEIKKLLKIPYVILHGQMNKEDMNVSLNDFMNHKVNVLLATNIIESGINVVEANLMIIFYAHMFGIAQLHQLKGRVGRNEKQSNVYFIVPKVLKDISIERINMIQEKSELGDGFNLSMQDMENRGSGTVAGYKQSGNDYGFGLEMYYEMLSDALGQKLHKKDYSNIAWIDCGDAYLPDDFILDSKLRLAFYKKISKVNSYTELDEIIQDLKEFGDYPAVVDNFIKLSKINLLTEIIKITKVVRIGNLFDIYYSSIDPFIYEKMIEFYEIKDNIIYGFDADCFEY